MFQGAKISDFKFSSQALLEMFHIAFALCCNYHVVDINEHQCPHCTARAWQSVQVVVCSALGEAQALHGLVKFGLPLVACLL